MKLYGSDAQLVKELAQGARDDADVGVLRGGSGVRPRDDADVGVLQGGSRVRPHSGR